MNNFIPTELPPTRPTATKWGLILAMASIVLTMVFFIANINMTTSPLRFLSWVIMGITYYMAIAEYRNQVAGGYLTIGRAVNLGWWMGLTTGILAGIFIYIYIGFIDTQFAENILTNTEENMLKSGQSQETIDIALAYTKPFVTPPAMAAMTVVSNIFMGIIVSLIIGLILKRDPNNAI